MNQKIFFKDINKYLKKIILELVNIFKDINKYNYKKMYKVSCYFYYWKN